MAIPIVEHGKSLPFLLSLITVMTCLTLSLSTAYGDQISVSPDKSLYQFGETVKISGSVNAVENEFITLLIVNPDGFLAKVDQFLPSSSGDFFRSYQVTGPLWKIEGSYVLTIAYQGIKTETSFVVVKSQATSSQITEPPKTAVAALKIPSWIKNNAAWWASGQINDSEFLIGIEFMINENIIVIPNLPQSVASPEGVVPDWVRNNAKWWTDGIISEGEFANGMKYLVEHGIIQVR